MSNKTNKERILDYMLTTSRQLDIHEFTTNAIAENLDLQRTNVSTILNVLYQEKRIDKISGKPVKYKVNQKESSYIENLDVFDALIGSKGSLKNAIDLSKAATLYPNASLPILIKGDKGTGKKKLMDIIAIFAHQNNIIQNHKQIQLINCKNFEDNKKLNQTLEDLAQQTHEEKRLLKIQHIEHLNQKGRELLFALIDLNLYFIICSVDGNDNHRLIDIYTSQFPVVISIPTLNERPLEEKFALMNQILIEESKAMSRSIRISASILMMVLLYETPENIRNLKRDIKIACANAYVREFGNKENDIFLYLNDFPNHIRNAILRYQDFNDELDKIIKPNHTYTFNEKSLSKYQEEDVNYKTIYEAIETKRNNLKKKGLSSDEINIILETDINETFNIVEASSSSFGEVSGSITKIVTQEIIILVRDFLKEAYYALGIKYEKNTFYSLCLHLSKVIERAKSGSRLKQDDLKIDLEDLKVEYALAQALVDKINKQYNIELHETETAIITMFISKRGKQDETNTKPIVLIAMHGDNLASAMATVVNSFLSFSNVYSFNLPLSGDIKEYYYKLKSFIQEINRNAGVLMLYDMGSLKTMAKNITEETHIPIRTIELPGSLIAIDAARKANDAEDLEKLYMSVTKSFDLNYPNLRSDLDKSKNAKVIITLCATGEGAAQHIKDYLDENLHNETLRIIALSTSDKRALKNKVNEIKKNHEITFIVGTYNPNLFNIPFIPIAQLLDTPIEKLNLLLAIDEAPKPKTKNIQKIFNFIHQQIPNINIDLLSKSLPEAIDKINKISSLDENQEIGLLLHMSAAIDKLTNNIETKKNTQKDTILQTNKVLFNKLKDILYFLESDFDIIFSDDDIANIILIIKKI